jgi:hypothetical protein
LLRGEVDSADSEALSTAMSGFIRQRRLVIVNTSELLSWASSACGRYAPYIGSAATPVCNVRW